MPAVSSFKVVCGADVRFFLSVDFDDGLVHHRFLAGALYGALGLYPTVAWGVGRCVGVTQHFLVMRLEYCAHVFGAAV